MNVIKKNRTNIGLRMPQSIETQRNNLTTQLISNQDKTAEGLVIFNTTTSCLEFWKGSTWISLFLINLQLIPCGEFLI